MAAGGQNPIARSPRHLRLSQLEIASGVESLAFNTNIPPERVPLQSDAHHQNGRTRALIVSISSQQAPVLGLRSKSASALSKYHLRDYKLPNSIPFGVQDRRL